MVIGGKGCENREGENCQHWSQKSFYALLKVVACALASIILQWFLISNHAHNICEKLKSYFSTIIILKY